MKKVALLTILLSTSFACLSQALYLSDYRSPGKPLQTASGVVSGSPYLSDEWGRGVAYINDKIKSGEVPLRYNVFDQVVEIKDADGNIFNLDPAKIHRLEWR